MGQLGACMLCLRGARAQCVRRLGVIPRVRELVAVIENLEQRVHHRAVDEFVDERARAVGIIGETCAWAGLRESLEGDERVSLGVHVASAECRAEVAQPVALRDHLRARWGADYNLITSCMLCEEATAITLRSEETADIDATHCAAHLDTCSSPEPLIAASSHSIEPIPAMRVQIAFDSHSRASAVYASR